MDGSVLDGDGAADPMGANLPVPRSHTCIQTIHSPPCQTSVIQARKLNMAIQETGFQYCQLIRRGLERELCILRCFCAWENHRAI
jgi:hypothetical protein